MLFVSITTKHDVDRQGHVLQMTDLFYLPLMALHPNKCLSHYIHVRVVCMQVQVLRNNTLACTRGRYSMSHCMVTGYIKATLCHLYQPIKKMKEKETRYKNFLSEKVGGTYDLKALVV